ncbi:MAG: glutaredoxin family protein [Burkholderiaceae bacterium]
MKTQSLPKRLSWLAAGVVLALSGAGLQAQQIYRSVGADGRVTFSDQPPPPSAVGKTTAAAGAPSGASGGLASLPFELRQVASRYPVTLYTGANCGPCGSGRAFLSSRGVPFTEKTVSTNEDIAALQRISGDSSLPFATIGGQQLKGYSETEWAQFLDAAGYPKTSQLPASYRQPAATPLVAAQKPDTPTADAKGGAAEGAAIATTTNRRSGPAASGSAPAANDNPAGIRF